MTVTANQIGVVLNCIGAFFLGYALKTKESKLPKAIADDQELISPSEVRTNRPRFYLGLGLIAAGSFLQLLTYSVRMF